MHILVTGSAGFIGSHTVERLLAGGHRVRGVDCFTDNYDPALKRANAALVADHPLHELVEADLVTADPHELLDGVDAVLHLAGQPGVRDSWADGFETYVERNVVATQRLLEAATDRPLQRFAAASSSSVYGDAETYPTPESALPRPVSPYGVTKLAGEHLAMLYHRNHGTPSVALRYFSVYGPRERPDKAIQRFLLAARRGEGIRVHGDGSQRRDFTYVDDVVEATVAALGKPPVGASINIARGHTETLSHVIDTVRQVTGAPLPIDRGPAEKGDVRVTSADISLARRLLGYAPKTDLTDGVRRQWEHVLAGPA